MARELRRTAGMDTPLQITYRGFEHTPDLDAFVRDQAASLEPAAGNRLTSCHVVIELDHQQHHSRVFHAHIDVTVPGGTIAVNREPQDQSPHQDAFVAVSDAFDAARRQIIDWEHRHHGQG